MLSIFLYAYTYDTFMHLLGKFVFFTTSDGKPPKSGAYGAAAGVKACNKEHGSGVQVFGVGVKPRVKLCLHKGSNVTEN